VKNNTKTSHFPTVGKSNFFLPAVELEPTQLKLLGFAIQHPTQLVQFVVNSLVNCMSAKKKKGNKRKVRN